MQFVQSKLGVRLIHKCVLYTRRYGMLSAGRGSASCCVGETFSFCSLLTTPAQASGLMCDLFSLCFIISAVFGGLFSIEVCAVFTHAECEAYSVRPLQSRFAKDGDRTRCFTTFNFVCFSPLWTESCLCLFCSSRCIFGRRFFQSVFKSISE